MKRKLKGFVIPTIYLLIITLSIISMNLLSKSLNKQTTNGQVTKIIKEDEIIPVFTEEQQSIIIPVEEQIEVSKYYYEKNGTLEEQVKSLIYYKKTYMQNTGYLYSNEEKFNVYAVLDGTVQSIKTDEILGTYITLMHDNELTTTYYNLEEIIYKEGDQINQGQIIGISCPTKLEQEKTYTFLFEVYYEGLLMNPKEFFDIDLTSFD